MAQLNEILVGRFNRGLQKLFGIKGGPAVATLAPEIMPNHNIGASPDQFYVEGWTRYGAGILVAAVAAASSDVRLRNPLNSGVIGLVENVSITPSLLARLSLEYGQPGSVDLAVVAPGRGIDGRQKGQANSLVLSSGNPAGGVQIGANIAQTLIALNVPWFPFKDIWDSIVLSPGDALELQVASQNVSGDFTIMWRERGLEEGERL